MITHADLKPGMLWLVHVEPRPAPAYEYAAGNNVEFPDIYRTKMAFLVIDVTYYYASTWRSGHKIVHTNKGRVFLPEQMMYRGACVINVDVL